MKKRALLPLLFSAAALFIAQGLAHAPLLVAADGGEKGGKDGGGHDGKGGGAGSGGAKRSAPFAVASAEGKDGSGGGLGSGGKV